MFDNYMIGNPEALDDVDSEHATVGFVLRMLDVFNIGLYFNPAKPVLEIAGEEDDMYKYCKKITTIFFHSQQPPSSSLPPFLLVTHLPYSYPLQLPPPSLRSLLLLP